MNSHTGSSWTPRYSIQAATHGSMPTSKAVSWIFHDISASEQPELIWIWNCERTMLYYSSLRHGLTSPYRWLARTERGMGKQEYFQHIRNCTISKCLILASMSWTYTHIWHILSYIFQLFVCRGGTWKRHASSHTSPATAQGSCRSPP